MKNKLLLSLIVSLFAVSAWAADVSVVENYSTNLRTTVSTSRISFQGKYTEWSYRNARSGGENDKLKDNTKGFWLSRKSGSSCYLESTLEGGIKNVAFNWRQFSTTDNGFKLVLNILTKAGSAAQVTQQSITFDGDDSHTNTDQSYSQAIAVKANDVKLTIQNSSTQSDGTTADGRLIVGPITITPYLLYTQKEVNVVLDQTGYINDQLIDNTESGKVSYSSDATDVAQVNSETGEITPVSVGDATITASWNEGVTTTYTLHVLKAVVETFANVSQGSSSGTGGSTWTTADICNWETKYARRGTNDKMLSKQYTWLTLDGSIRGYIKTTNLEGGIKDVSFNYGQFGAEAGKLLRWKVSAIGSTTNSDVIERDGDLGENGSYSRGEYYTHAFNCTENVQLEILNMSVKDDGSQPTSNARLLIGDIYITPYLLYTTKECTLNMRVASANPTRTYKNEDLIDNTGEAVTYSITDYGTIPTDKISVGSDGTVTVADRFQTGDITVQAKWSNVTTTYILHVLGKDKIGASFTNNKVAQTVTLPVNGAIVNSLSRATKASTPVYTSSNPDVATIANENAGSLNIIGVGTTTITATLAENDNCEGAVVSYTLYVRDLNARKEQFSIVTANGVVGETLTPWAGDLFDWQAQYQVRRKSGDNINEGTETPHLGTSIGIQDPNGTPASSILQSKAPVEGGIKHLSFYWSQWGAAGGGTRRIAVYADDVLIGFDEHPNGSSGTNGDEFLLGINNAMKSNKELVIKNESYVGTLGNLSNSENCSRIVIGVIEITPYLLYTDKAHTMRVGDAPYTHPLDIDNTEDEGSIEYSLVPSNSDIASINASTGEVTVLKAGEVTVKATWSEGAYTTYRLAVKPRETASLKVETFPNATEATYIEGVSSIEQDQSTWTYRQAGFKSNENFDPNVAFIRQKRSNEDKQSYIMSASISGGIRMLAFDWNLVGNEPNVTRWDIRVQVKQGETLKKEIRLTSDSGDALENVHKRNDGWRSAVLTDINVTGDFIIRVENKSDIQGTYTSGNKARFVLDNIEWKSTPEISLNDNGTDNEETLATYNNQNVDVTLNGRTIYCDGDYNTICLPFALSAEQIAASPLAGAKIMDFTNAYLSGPEGSQTLDIRFDEVNQMDACRPYLISKSAASDIVNPVFEDVTISNNDAATVAGTSLNFVGILEPKELTESCMFLGAGNNLYWVYSEDDSKLNAFRAYFEIPNNVAPAPVRNAPARIVTRKDVVTDISTTDVNPNVEKRIENGHLVIIRDGMRFNAMGQRIQ